MWKIAPDNCIPFYKFDEQKDPETGFDLDFQKIVDGHTLNCDVTGTATLNQNLEPGQGPKTLTPQQLIEEQAAAEAAQAAANEAGTNINGPPPGSGSFGGSVGTIANPNAVSAIKRSNVRPTRGRSMQEKSPRVLARREKLRKERVYCVDRLVISHLKEHSATDVCAMASS